eukprot:4436515-Prymnesium_polylepis.1
MCEDAPTADGGAARGGAGAQGAPRRVSIHVSSILSGKCLAQIDSRQSSDPKISALCYNEQYSEIITGNENGILQYGKAGSQETNCTAGLALHLRSPTQRHTRCFEDVVTNNDAVLSRKGTL